MAPLWLDALTRTIYRVQPRSAAATLKVYCLILLGLMGATGACPLFNYGPAVAVSVGDVSPSTLHVFQRQGLEKVFEDAADPPNVARRLSTDCIVGKDGNSPRDGAV